MAFLLPPAPVFLAAPVLVTAPVLLAVPELLAVPVSEDAFEPQPTLITPIRATMARAASGLSLLLMSSPFTAASLGRG
jgi:hypothetical protein